MEDRDLRKMFEDQIVRTREEANNKPEEVVMTRRDMNKRQEQAKRTNYTKPSSIKTGDNYLAKSNKDIVDWLESQEEVKKVNVDQNNLILSVEYHFDNRSDINTNINQEEDDSYLKYLPS